jgi:hypothetical protein
VGIAHDGVVIGALVGEISIPVVPEPVENIPSRDLEWGERRLWERLLRLAETATADIERAGLLLKNIYITFSFAAKNGVFLVALPAEEERKYYDILSSNKQLWQAIRSVQDRRYGIRARGHDLDIIDPQTSMQGLIIPVAVGVVVLAAAIATAIWQSRIANEIAKKYRKLLFRTDRTLCSDPNSALCKKWQVEKKSSGYENHMTLADTLKQGVRKITGGLSTGLLLIIPIVALLALGGKRK